MKKMQGRAPSLWFFLPIMVSTMMMVGCPTPPNPPPNPSPDAGEEPDAASPATCAAWCKHALDLRCASAQPTRAGASCADVCVNVQGGPAKFNLRCRISAKTCAAADVCEN